MRKLLAGVLGIAIIVGIFWGINLKTRKDFLVVATNFPAYDFARAVAGAENVKMLIPAGTEMHGFEPTPEDLTTIARAELFIYNGGESEGWAGKILESIDKTESLKMMDLVKTVEEEIVEGMETEDDTGEIDEHIWTNPKNAIKIVEKIAEEMTKIRPDETEKYNEKAQEYIAELEKVDMEIREVVANGKRKVLVFGDRFPLRYFTDEYGLEYFAAFPGCAEETEASAKTIKFLIDKVNENKIPVVFKIELSSGEIAEAIAEEAGAKILTFQSLHNVSKEDFSAGKTYVEIMRENIRALNEALK